MPAHLKACLIAAFLILLAFVNAVRSGPRIELRVPIRIATEPADVWITVMVEPRPDHRLLLIEADGMPGEYRRSDLTLEGERAARLRQIWFKGMRAGCYIFSASVYDASRRLAVSSSPLVTILGREGNPCA